MRRKSEYGVDGATLRQRRLPVRDEPATLSLIYTRGFEQSRPRTAPLSSEWRLHFAGARRQLMRKVLVIA